MKDFDCPESSTDSIWDKIRQAFEQVRKDEVKRSDLTLPRGTSVKVYQVGPVIRIDIK